MEIKELSFEVTSLVFTIDSYVIDLTLFLLCSGNFCYLTKYYLDVTDTIQPPAPKSPPNSDLFLIDLVSEYGTRNIVQFLDSCFRYVLYGGVHL